MVDCWCDPGLLYEVQSKSFKTSCDWMEHGTVMHTQQELAVTFVSQNATWRHAVNIRTCIAHIFCDHVHVLICNFTMDLINEQRASFKFWVRFGKSAIETLEMQWNSELGNCFECHSYFKRGRTSLEDNERSGQPSTLGSSDHHQESCWHCQCVI